ncbi:MAG: NADH-quinone oxidoreductase subunit C [Gemmatimonadetes bacterium]|jgi:NADH-quinone oxidoreductase subunit C|nr:NADH-quinone oxidoreductase subunit C [Gemmatimonadota bacterium]|tara:strand:+ start:1940 stop:2518 length:579 start_codon:yes stop_codon:yes gene_type:complete
MKTNTESAQTVYEELVEQFGSAVLGSEMQCEDQRVIVIDPKQNFEVLSWLKDSEEHHYDLLIDLTAVDYGAEKGVQVVYQLWSVKYKRLLRVKCPFPGPDLEISSVAELWGCANWLEREVFDLFGVDFSGHPDLRRILMPKNYSEGHPLRKDFPLRGRFSREKQTEIALDQSYEDYYRPEQLRDSLGPQKED